MEVNGDWELWAVIRLDQDECGSDNYMPAGVELYGSEKEAISAASPDGLVVAVTEMSENALTLLGTAFVQAAQIVQ